MLSLAFVKKTLEGETPSGGIIPGENIIFIAVVDPDSAPPSFLSSDIWDKKKRSSAAQS